jgi:RNA polymerase sigma factor (sigma-70 family)
LVRHNLRLIVHTWARMALPGAPSADAFQEAAIQLQRAAERFDPGRGITFATYATPWLRSAFLAHHNTTVRALKLQLELAQLEDAQLKDANQPLAQAWVEPALGSALEPARALSMDSAWQAVPVRELLDLLTPQERQLIRYRYLRAKPLNIRQIARRLSLGQGCLADLEQRALVKMHQHLAAGRFECPGVR